MPLRATEFLRKLRGGAQAHLVKAEDGELYAVKFRSNLQGRRILVNEWIAHAAFRQLRIATPAVAMVELTADFIAAHPELYIRTANRTVPPEPGWHFGSRFPGDPERMAVYDFLPRKILLGVENLHDFRAAAVADRWLSNADARQAVFFRARIRQFAPSVAAHGARVGFVASMIDNGYALNGPEWSLLDSPGFGLFGQRDVYESVNGLDAFQPWLDQIRYFPESVLEAARREIPPSWLEGDEDQLEALLEKLLRRRTDVPDLLKRAKQAQPNPFPNWLP